jgi:hypothetical protein
LRLLVRQHRFDDVFGGNTHHRADCILGTARWGDSARAILVVARAVSRRRSLSASTGDEEADDHREEQQDHDHDPEIFGDGLDRRL